MKLEQMINADFANLIYSGSDEYDFELLEFKNEELLPIDLPDIGLTKFAEAMPDYYKVNDCTVLNYREYYRKEKSHIIKYTNAQIPYWI